MRTDLRPTDAARTQAVKAHLAAVGVGREPIVREATLKLSVISSPMDTPMSRGPGSSGAIEALLRNAMLSLERLDVAVDAPRGR